MPIKDNHKEKRTKKVNNLSKRLLQRKGGEALIRLIGTEKFTGLSDINDILDIPDIEDFEETDKLT